MLWVKTGHFELRQQNLLYPRRWTFIEVSDMSAKGHKQTSRRLFNHLVGAE